MKSSRISTMQCWSNDFSSLNYQEIETTKTANVDFSIPEMILNDSMSKYERQAKQKLKLSQLIDQISTTVIEVIDKLLHERIYSQISNIINEVLCIRDEVTSSKQENNKQEVINREFQQQIKKLKNKIEDITNKSHSISFQSIINDRAKKHNHQNQNHSEGFDVLIADIYDFMKKNEATKLFKECQQKLQRFNDTMASNNSNIMHKVDELRQKQKPINENLRRQIDEAISKDAINKEVKKSIKLNIKYIFDEIVRSRKDIDELKTQLIKLRDRQRELQFNHTLLDHKLM